MWLESIFVERLLEPIVKKKENRNYHLDRQIMILVSVELDSMILFVGLLHVLYEWILLL